MRIVHLAVAALPPLLLAGCATADPGAATAEGDERQCFWPSQVNGFGSAGTEDRLHIRTAGGNYYLFETFSPCPGMDLSFRLRLERDGPGPICAGHDADIVFPSVAGGGLDHCRVRMIRKLSEAEADAL